MGDLISCLCVTRNPELLKRSLQCLKNQTHQNWEALILHQQDSFELPIQDDRFKVIQANSRMNLGQLRNLAVSKASGDFVMQWDDDDWYHPKRMDMQLMYLGFGLRACFLSQWTIHDFETNKLYSSEIRIWEGSILARREGFPTYEPTAQEEELPVVQHFRGNLILVEAPELYVYSYHGKNTWSRKHFLKLINNATPITQSELQVLRDSGFNYDEIFQSK